MRSQQVLFLTTYPMLVIMLLVGCAAPTPLTKSVTPPPTELLTISPVPPTSSQKDVDLVIRSFRILEYDWLILGGFEATAEVVVKNVGNGPAPTFNVGVVAINREEKYVRFSFSYDPAFIVELAPGQEITLTGSTGLGWHGNFDVTCADENYDPTLCAMRDENTLWLMAIVDYCDGDEVPAYCAIEEVDETNNTSSVVVVEKTE